MLLVLKIMPLLCFCCFVYLFNFCPCGWACGDECYLDKPLLLPGLPYLAAVGVAFDMSFPIVAWTERRSWHHTSTSCCSDIREQSHLMPLLLLILYSITKSEMALTRMFYVQRPHLCYRKGISKRANYEKKKKKKECRKPLLPDSVAVHESN